MFESRLRQTLRPLLLLEVSILIITAMVISRDYQDSWILEGLELPFAVFMVTNVIYFLVEDDSKWLVLFATLSRFTIALIPNLKYEWFLGTAIDQHVQFRFARFVSETGHIETGTAYSDTPIMHVLFASFSEISAIPLLHSFKYLPVVSWSIFPAITYAIVKKALRQHEKSSLLKYALLISSVPIDASLSYIVTGTLFGSLFAILSLSAFLESSEKRERSYLILAIFFALALVLSHFVSSALVMVAFFLILLFMTFRIYKSESLSLTFPVLFVLLELTWIITQLNKATGYGVTIDLILSNFWRGIIGIEPKYWVPTGIRFRFFDLNFFDRIRILTVFHGGDLIVLLLALVGIITLRKTTRSIPAKFLSYYFLSLWMFVPFQLLVTSGEAGLVQYFRVIRHTLVLCPILGAFLLHHIDKKIRLAKPIIALILFTIIALSTVETYGYQPLLPPSSAVSESLPSDQPVVFLTWIGANSIYQRSMIHHLEKYASKELQIASDDMTHNQIIGLTGYEFSVNQSTNYNPLLKLSDEDVRERDYDVFMIHFPGKAGGLAESAESRTKGLILKTILNSSVLYTNEECFVLIYRIAED